MSFILRWRPAVSLRGFDVAELLEITMSRYRVLGALEVTDDRGTVRRPGPSARLVLAQLLLRANRSVPAAVLAEALWRGRPPATARRALRNHVSALRALIEPDRVPGAPSTLAPDGEGWVLWVWTGTTDVERFETATRAGRRARRQGRWAEAVECYRAGLGEWRGSAYQDVAGLLPAARVRAAQLEEQRTAALEACLDAELRRGRAGEVVAELAGLVEEHPLRQRPAALLMLALCRSGRPADALAVHAALTRRLHDEAGLAPGPELARLERAVLTRHPSVEPPAPWIPAPAPCAACADSVLPTHLTRVSRRHVTVSGTSFCRGRRW